MCGAAAVTAVAVVGIVAATVVRFSTGIHLAATILIRFSSNIEMIVEQGKTASWIIVVVRLAVDSIAADTLNSDIVEGVTAKVAHSQTAKLAIPSQPRQIKQRQPTNPKSAEPIPSIIAVPEIEELPGPEKDCKMPIEEPVLNQVEQSAAKVLALEYSDSDILGRRSMGQVLSDFTWGMKPAGAYQMTRLYKHLNLAPSPPPTQAAIKEAFVSISLSSHPDRVKRLSPKDQKEALARFMKAKDAYEVLKHPEKRRDYDHRFGLKNDIQNKGSADFSSWSDPHPQHHAKRYNQQQQQQYEQYDKEEEEEENDKKDFTSRFSRFYKANFTHHQPQPTSEFGNYDQRAAFRATALIWTAICIAAAGGFWYYSWANQDPITLKKKETDAKRAFEERMAMPDMFIKKHTIVQSVEPEKPVDSASRSIQLLSSLSIPLDDGQPVNLSNLDSQTLARVEPAIVEFVDIANQREAQTIRAVLQKVKE
ncbi:UNVERIFIED_CONTAM: hypothetical protein HDU68_000582 [Siphonaria sp. JEL0065]|nr:hypothetical protein HDU68_000582 [Siphonaria sp. JEL0065]